MELWLAPCSFSYGLMRCVCSVGLDMYFVCLGVAALLGQIWFRGGQCPVEVLIRWQQHHQNASRHP